MLSHSKLHSPPVPASAFTVAVTGHRNLGFDQPRLTDKLDQVLSLLRELVVNINPNTETRVLSALAVGADQIVAQAALRSQTETSPGWELHAILPFERVSYVQSLSSGLDAAVQAGNQFEQLINSAKTVFEIADIQYPKDSATDSAAKRKTQYWIDGRFVSLGNILAQQADIMLAVWDGEPPRGRGGTADVVAHAVRDRVPVLRIDPNSLTVTLLQSESGIQNSVRLASEGQPVDPEQLTSLIAKLLDVSTITSPNNRDSLFASLDAFMGSKLPSTADSAQDTKETQKRTAWNKVKNFYKHGYAFPESAGETTHWWHYQWLLNVFSDSKSTHEQDDAATSAQATSKSRFKLEIVQESKQWGRASHPNPGNRPPYIEHIDHMLRPVAIAADTIATARGHSYRSSYVITFFGGVIAVWIGLLGLLSHHDKHLFVLVEVLILIGLLSLFIISSRRDWHHRWLNSRTVSEQLRGVRFRAWIGFSGRRFFSKNTPWTSWYTSNISASVGLPDGRLDANGIEFISSDLLQHVRTQQRYHKRNSERLGSLHHSLETLGQWSLIVIIVVATLYVAATLFGLIGLDSSVKYWVTIFCAGLPVLAGALTGIRYQGDFERFATRSKDTAAQLDETIDRITSLIERAQTQQGAKVPSNQPLFEELVAVITDVCNVFESDLNDWRFVYSARPSPEPG